MCGIKGFAGKHRTGLEKCVLLAHMLYMKSLLSKWVLA